MSAEEVMARTLGLLNDARRTVIQSPDRRDVQQLSQSVKRVHQVSL
jgi:hypothetical protein